MRIIWIYLPGVAHTMAGGVECAVEAGVGSVVNNARAGAMLPMP
ncbi:MAG: hypothetical protein H6R25_542 [Proteobacteria bacterium]|nr:hypothetical protein [Pseudomonadota bacterium]